MSNSNNRYRVLKKYENCESSKDKLPFITIDQYALISMDEKRYLLFSFINNVAETLQEVTIKLEQYTEKGDYLGVRTITLDGLNAKQFEVFGRDKKIVLSDRCGDIRLTVESGKYGKYLRRNENGEEVLTYIEEKTPRYSEIKISELADGKRQSKTTVYKANPVKIGIASLLVVILASVLFFVYLNYFTETETSFVRDGCEYYIIQSEDDYGLELTRYRGLGGKTYIPDYIGGYKVKRIKRNAFSNVSNLYSVEIEGNPEIERYAFMDFTSLKTIKLGKVTEIPEYAFKNCTALQAIESDYLQKVGRRAFQGCKELKKAIFGNKGGISLGDAVFMNCADLTEVVFASDFELAGRGSSLFYGCPNIKKLSVASLTQECNFAQSITANNFLGGVFPGLEELTVGYMHNVPYDFCSGLSHLKSVAINTLDEYTIGKKAFFNCYSLEKFTTTDNIIEVGESAFENTSIASFNGEKLKKLGARAFAGDANLIAFNLNESIEEVPNSLFEGCTSLTEVKLSLNCKVIGERAFLNCASLTDFTLPASVTEIKKEALSNCKSLTKIVIPKSVLTIGEYAFSGCVKLEDFTIPKSVEKIGEGILYECNELKTLKLPYVGADKTSALVEKPGFGYFFKQGNYNYSIIPQSLKKVTITQSEIYDGIFSGASNVKEIVFEKDEEILCEYVGKEAFAGCNSLTKVTWPSTVTEIDSKAFLNCYGLTTKIIDSNVTYIGANVFEGCLSLKDLSLPFLGQTLDNEKPLVYLFGEEKGVPNSLKNLTIQNGKIPKEAFMSCDGLETVTIYGKSAEEVGDNAFWCCTRLRTVALPSSVKSIGNWAFYNCSSLTNFDFNVGLSKIGEEAFLGCGRLKTIVLPETLTTIGSSAFRNCAGLTSLYLPERNVNIDNTSFYDCYHLYAIYNCQGKSIGRGFGIAQYALGVYDGIAPSAKKDGLEFILETGVFNPKLYLIDYSGTETELVLPSSVSYNNNLYTEYEIPDKLFFYNDNRIGLKVVNLGDGVSRIGAYAFAQCYSLQKMILGRNLQSISENAFCFSINLSSVIFSEYSTIESIGQSAFNNCGITEIELPESVKTIDEYAFMMCTALSKAVIPGSVRVIGSNAFSGCGLKTIEIKDSSLSDRIIEDYAFDNCNLLRKIEIPSSIQRVGYSFSGCTALSSVVVKDGVGEIADGAFTSLNVESVDIGKNVKIGVRAFAECRSLKNLILGGGNDIGDYAFENCSLLKSLEIGDGDGRIGNSAFANCSSLQTASIGKNVSEISENAFYSCETLSVVNLSSGLKRINAGAFNNCIALKSIVIPNGTQSLGNQVFYQCYELSEVSLPLELKEIGVEAFAYCKNLQNITIPTGIDIISNSMFSECTGLKEVTISSGVTEIGYSAFNNCSHLELVRLPKSLSTVYTGAFDGCIRLYEIFNPSHINLQIGSEEYGGIAKYAYQITTNMSKPSMNKGWADGMYLIHPDSGWVLVESELDNTEIVFGAVNIDGAYVDYYRIADNVFNGKNIFKVTIGKEVEELGKNAFANNGNLTEVTFTPECKIEKLSEGVFSCCYNLEKVTFSDSIKKIDRAAFYQCNLYKMKRLPSSLEEIGEDAFAFSQIMCVYLPKNLSVISDQAFDNCYRLYQVYNLSTKLGKITPGDTKNGCVSQYALVVDTDEKEPEIEYVYHSDWKCQLNFLKIKGEWSLFELLFSSDETLWLPETLSAYGISSYKIENKAFYENISLNGIRKIVIPKTVTKVDTQKFSSYAPYVEVFFEGTKAEWTKIIAGKPNLNERLIHYRSQLNCLHYLGKTEMNEIADKWTVWNDDIVTESYEYRLTNTIAPTCTKDGYFLYTCPNCGENRSVPSGKKATGHKYDKDGVCSQCGDKKADNPSKKLPNNGGKSDADEVGRVYSKRRAQGGLNGIINKTKEKTFALRQKQGEAS